MPGVLHITASFESWRDAARGLLARGVPPAEVVWTDDRQPDLLPLLTAKPSDVIEAAARVPREFVATAKLVAHHRDAGRWDLLYRVLFRLTQGEPHLLRLATDDDVRRLRDMEKSVRHDRHKMHAFVRFRVTKDDEGREHYVAFYRPQHPIVRLAAPFFRERFGVMRWAILTPDDSVGWDGARLTFGPGVDAPPPGDDGVERLWLTYYASIYNPARLNPRKMVQDMPRRYWPTLPEAQLIPELIAETPTRLNALMAKAKRDAATMGLFGTDEATCEHDPDKPPRTDKAAPVDLRSQIAEITSLKVLSEEAKGCRICPWACHSTQTVFGEGPADARLVFVGEQPGDVEDRKGKPFIGPAGQLLAEVLEEVGIDREQVYVTNSVKHFKFEPRGTRRIHQTPDARDVSYCRPWLERELAIVKPEMLVCLGATAAKGLLGNGFRITQSRGQVMKTDHAPWTMATYHPSALLRMPDEAAKKAARDLFTVDLRLAAQRMRDAT